MKITGSTKPSSTGTVQTTQTAARRIPASGAAWASTAPARAPRTLEKRMRFCARCSRFSSTITTTSSTVASCAAAIRLSIASQAL
jgi:hypothetical protein